MGRVSKRVSTPKVFCDALEEGERSKEQKKSHSDFLLLPAPCSLLPCFHIQFCRCVWGLIRFQHLDEGIGRNRDPPELLHLLFALFLLVEQLALPADVAAIALRGHVLPHFL